MTLFLSLIGSCLVLVIISARFLIDKDAAKRVGRELRKYNNRKL